MKIVFLVSSGAIVYYMRFHKVVKMTYDREQDTFRYQFLVLPCAVLAMLINNQRTFVEVRRVGGEGAACRTAGENDGARICSCSGALAQSNRPPHSDAGSRTRDVRTLRSMFLSLPLPSLLPLLSSCLKPRRPPAARTPAWLPCRHAAAAPPPLPRSDPVDVLHLP